MTTSTTKYPHSVQVYECSDGELFRGEIKADQHQAMISWNKLLSSTTPIRDRHGAIVESSHLFEWIYSRKEQIIKLLQSWR